MKASKWTKRTNDFEKEGFACLFFTRSMTSNNTILCMIWRIEVKPEKKEESEKERKRKNEKKKE